MTYLVQPSDLALLIDVSGMTPSRANLLNQQASALVQSYCRRDFSSYDEVPWDVQAVVTAVVERRLNGSAGLSSEGDGDYTYRAAGDGEHLGVIALTDVERRTLKPYRSKTGSLGSIRLRPALAPQVAPGVVLPEAAQLAGADVQSPIAGSGYLYGRGEGA